MCTVRDMNAARTRRIVVLALSLAAIAVWGLVFARMAHGSEPISQPSTGWVTEVGQITNISDDGLSAYWQPDCSEMTACISGGRAINIQPGVVIGQSYSLTHKG